MLPARIEQTASQEWLFCGAGLKRTFTDLGIRPLDETHLSPAYLKRERSTIGPPCGLQKMAPADTYWHSTSASWCDKLKKRLSRQFARDDAGGYIPREGRELR
jgi:hypothetical protein